jgi:hypothetical protein
MSIMGRTTMAAGKADPLILLLRAVFVFAFSVFLVNAVTYLFPEFAYRDEALGAAMALAAVYVTVAVIV